jgi:tetratricopeptide (TPR) repeat protein
MKSAKSPVKLFLTPILLGLFAIGMAACTMPKNVLPDLMPDAEFNTLMVDADSAMHDAKWDVALKKLQQAGGLKPDDLAVKLKQGLVYQNSGRLALAHNAYQQIIDVETEAKGKNLEIVQKARNYQAKLGFAPLDATSSEPNKVSTPVAAVQQPAEATETKAADLPMAVEAPVALAPPAAEEVPQQSANVEDAILERIQAWVQAWQKKRVSDYYGFYVADFRGDYTSHAIWRKQRNARISAAGNITIRLDDLKIELQDADNAVAGFRQTYQSSSLTDVGIKTLRLKKVGDLWLIADEQFRKQ